MSEIKWQYYPKSDRIVPHLEEVIEIFKSNESHINSSDHTHQSNKVLALLRQDLTALGYDVEGESPRRNTIKIPVLFGRNGKMGKSFDADAYNKEKKTVVEVEAGRGVANNQFLKDLFEACMMNEIDYLVISVRNIYRGKKDFEYVDVFFDVLFTSNKISLPLKGILLIGY